MIESKNLKQQIFYIATWIGLAYFSIILLVQLYFQGPFTYIFADIFHVTEIFWIVFTYMIMLDVFGDFTTGYA